MDAAVVSKVSRIRGWLLIILGACLSVGMAAIIAFLAWTIAHNDRPSGTHWTGSHEMTVRTFELLATVLIFGAVAAIGGSFQLQHGRPNWLAMLVLLGLVAVMCFLGREIMQLGR
jgi:ABC-type Na+ efflux pump permease subunit